MKSRIRLVGILFALALIARPAGSFITADDGGDTGGGGGGGGGGGSTQTGDEPPDGTPIFDPTHGRLTDIEQLEKLGFTCSLGHFAEIECSGCLPQDDGTKTCEDSFCHDDVCDAHRSRAGVPMEVDPARYTLWAVGFAPDASS